ncbi:MAG: cobyrinic acid ac-diamide synthase [Clostridia bacterium BRH_c25]|nr:MAG: cobyrinic acid ac-diamide synthase [Clostridia bacterium BRH_c25]
MKSVLITAPASGSGKTTLTMGILRAMKNMGLDVCAFKTGPDYIDGAFLGKACKGRNGNLDMHLQGKEGLLSAFSMAAADYCVIEGAMGYFDGIYNTCINSSYDISKELGINSILVYTPKGEMFSAIPKIKGMAEFEASNIKAVIFNNISEKYYEMLKEAVEKHTKLKVLGFLPPMDAVELKSRHLGLVQSIELEDIDFQIEEISKMVSTNIDLDGIIKLMTDINTSRETAIGKYDVTVAIAKDKAFSFYYSENLSLLEAACDVTCFSPLEDNNLPRCDLLYLGGGYPEVFKEELAKNKAMLSSIKEYSQRGGYIYAECGGFMYLTDSIDGEAMVGVFPGQSMLTETLQNFGYMDIELKADCMLGKKGDKITAHEFHKSVTDVKDDKIFAISKTMGNKKWEGGYIHKNTYGGYPHISFIGNLQVLKNILNSIERNR